MPDRSYADYPPEDRAELFHETFGNDIDGARTFKPILLALGDYLSRIANSDAADSAMTALVNAWLHADLKQTDTWREFVDRQLCDLYSETSLGAIMHDLLAYAEFGIVLHNSSDPDVLAKHIASMIQRIEGLWSATPVKQWDLEQVDEISQLLVWAKGRWALDNGEPIEPAALARIGNVSEGSIRNMMSKKKLRSEGGKIPAQDALEWLEPRPDHWNSVWKEQELGAVYQAEEPIEESYVFVPVSRDGSIFHPGLKGDGGYRVGPKGDELQFETFDVALQHLQSLPKPYWRRQNASGAWAIVAGTRWERLSESDLTKFANDAERRLQSGL